MKLVADSDENDSSKDLTSEESLQEEADSDIQEVQSAIHKLQRDKPSEVTEVMAMMGMGPMPNPLHQKMNEGHITQVLELAANHDERQYNLSNKAQTDESSESTSVRRYSFAAFFSLLALIIIILFLFSDKPDILIPLLTGIGGGSGGFLAGWGFGKSSN